MLAVAHKIEMALILGLLAILSLSSYVDANQKRASDYLKKEHSLMRPYTVANKHPHPYISAQVNNGSVHYDHDTDGTHTEVAGCSCSIRNKNHITQVAIRYSRQRLTIMTDIDGKSEWKPCVDVPGIHLPTGYYFGASAATGELADNHDIISYKVFELEVEGANEDYDYANVNPSADFFAPPRDHVDDPKGAFKNVTLTWKKMFLLVFCILLGVSVCIIVGVLVFMKRQEHNRKRFY
ncbi:vesicular integral-membrane protein VIP36-like [Anneissia japonica]|uniref:vesicular integral-membrane protein VIP36-like n=1 Tax=Anneissia japonica TaxID=1529436 RepID=UPI0014259D33|nr:vesicular integral-membrane protein VIP36-like [Anneissia japonica]